MSRLTDRQIYDVLFYPREKDGSLRPRPDRAEPTIPDLPPTPENQRAVLFALGAAIGASPEALERAWREKYPEAEGAGDGPG